MLGFFKRLHKGEGNPAICFPQIPQMFADKVNLCLSA
jgi:hypothetical protein